MNMLARLIILTACCCLMRGVLPATVITAPSIVTETTGGVGTREQGPTAWICTVLALDRPWTSYANIRGYLEGGNDQGKDYTNLVLYPVMEIFHNTKNDSRLCVYLPAEDHCFPPAPNTNQVKAVKQLKKRTYYSIRFWGQASDARVKYYKTKLTEALVSQTKAAQFDLFFVSYFSDHVREVRYNPGMATRRAAVPTRQTKITFGELQNERASCPAPSVNSSTETVESDGGDVYTRRSVANDRMNLSVVQTEMNSTAGANSIPECANAASMGGYHAFSFEGNKCNAYNFGKGFCPCSGQGDFNLYVNMRLWGRSSDPAFSYSNIVVDHVCYFFRYLDIANCNQTCKGVATDAFVKTKTGDEKAGSSTSVR